MSSFFHIWEKLTSDASILQIIPGDCIEFLSDPPSQVSQPPNSVPRDHVSLVDKEIKRLLDKGVIVPCDHEPGEFISPIFTVPKKDGSELYSELKEFKHVYQELAFQNGHNSYYPKTGDTELLDGLFRLEGCLL